MFFFWPKPFILANDYFTLNIIHRHTGSRSTPLALNRSTEADRNVPFELFWLGKKNNCLYITYDISKYMTIHFFLLFFKAFLMSPVPTEVFRFKEDLRRSQAAFRDALTEQVFEKTSRRERICFIEYGDAIYLIYFLNAR